MSKRSTKKKGRRKRSHPNMEAYNGLVSAYQKAFPGMDYEEARDATKRHWEKWKDEFGLGMYFEYMFLMFVDYILVLLYILLL